MLIKNYDSKDIRDFIYPNYHIKVYTLYYLYKDIESVERHKNDFAKRHIVTKLADL